MLHLLMYIHKAHLHKFFFDYIDHLLCKELRNFNAWFFLYLFLKILKKYFRDSLGEPFKNQAHEIDQLFKTSRFLDTTILLPTFSK